MVKQRAALIQSALRSDQGDPVALVEGALSPYCRG